METSKGIDILKAEIEYTAGRKILTSKDCIDLSEAIFKKTEYRINSNTLRRFFGLVKADYPASANTLNILAVYCGSSSFDELINYNLSNEQVENEAPNLLKYLITLFQNINVVNVNDPTFIRLTHTTIDFLNQNPSIAYQLQKAIAKTNNGKRFYFEQFVNVDKLDSFYGKGLRYYLAENKANDAQIFGHALLCFRYWLTMNNPELVHHHKQLVACNISEDVNLFTCARYYAARLFYAEANGFDTAVIIWEANEFYINIKASNKYNNSFPCFELVFAEALILTSHYSEALVYTTEGSRRNIEGGQSQPYADMELLKNFRLYHSIVLFNLGNEKKAAEIFEKINPFDFYFITKTVFKHTLLVIRRKAQQDTFRKRTNRSACRDNGVQENTFSIKRNTMIKSDLRGYINSL